MKRLILIGLLIVTGCTVSLVYINRPDDVKLEQEQNSKLDADVRKKDSIGINLKGNNNTKNK